MKTNMLFFFSLLALLFIACNDDPDPPVNECETTDLTYTADIATILNTSCATAGCHEMGSTTTFEMHDFAAATAAVGFGRIIGAINHDTDFSPMPYPEGTAKLDDCKINQITAWINDGAPE